MGLVPYSIVWSSEWQLWSSSIVARRLLIFWKIKYKTFIKILMSIGRLIKWTVFKLNGVDGLFFFLLGMGWEIVVQRGGGWLLTTHLEWCGGRVVCVWVGGWGWLLTSHRLTRPVSCNRDQILCKRAAFSGWLAWLPHVHSCFCMIES